MEQISIMEAARRCGVSDKTIRRAVAAGKLAVQRPQSNRALIDLRDLEAWRKLEGDETKQQMEEMQQRIGELERQIARLSATVAGLSATRLHKAKITELPPYLEGLYSFTNWHGVGQTEVRNAIKMGALHVISGKWASPKGRIEEALDQAGQHEFWGIFHNHSGFRGCDQCPHHTETVVQV